MSDDVEKRLQALEQELAAARKQLSAKPTQEANSKPAKRRPHTLRAALVAAMILSVAGVATYFVTRPSATLPKSTIAQANFPVYYPSKLPDGYVLDEKSVRYQSSVLIYELDNASKTITVSQQAKPKGLNNFKSIDGMVQTVTRLGVSFVGTKTPTQIILGDQTMITINGVNGVANQTVSDVVNNLKSIN